MIIRYCRNGHRMTDENVERREYKGAAVTFRGKGIGRIRPRGGNIIVCPVCGDRRFV